MTAQARPQKQLSDEQLYILLQHGQELQKIEDTLPPGPAKDAMREFQERAVANYAGVIEAEPVGIRERAQHALGHAYLAMVDHTRSTIKTIMQKIGLTPSAPASDTERFR